MKGSLLVLSMFFVGCVLGYVWNFSGWELGDTHHLSMYILYALMFQADTAGHHRRNPAVFGIGQCAADSLECVRLFGCGQRTGVLFGFVYSDYGTQNPRPWCTVGYGTGHDCTSDECHPRAGGTGGSSFHLQMLREAGSYFGGRSNFGRCSPSLHYPCVWKGNGASCHLPWAAGRYVRAVFHFFVLQVVEGNPPSAKQRDENGGGEP